MTIDIFSIPRTDDIDNIPVEYFCCTCLQLRLSLRTDNVSCGNCKTDDIIVGAVGTLDKAALIKQYRKNGC